MKHISLISLGFILYGCEDSHDGSRMDPSSEPYVEHPDNINPDPDNAHPHSTMKPSTPAPKSNATVPGEIYARVYNEKKAGPNPSKYLDRCIHGEFRMGARSYSVPQQAFAEGSDTRLFLTSDNQYVLKIQDTPSLDSREMFWREHAAMHQARHTGVVSVIEPVADLSPMSAECQSRSFVMKNVLGKDLRNHLSMSVAQVLELGQVALKALEKLHDTGVIHGDIHWGNIMLGSVFAMKSSLTLIDFGRSMSYIDPSTGKHKRGLDMMPFNALLNLNWNFLSVNELEGKPVSRADDVFRLAEVLITLRTGSVFGFVRLPGVTPTYVAQQKRIRKFGWRVPKKIQNLYRYAMNLGFEERPNYDILN
jgi:tRNA A-37 threonylcarbamoyl transferase component Bud32